MASKYGDTPAHHAAREDTLEIIGLLARSRVDFDIPDDSGKTAADIIVETGDRDLIDALRNRNLDGDELNDDVPEPSPNQDREDGDEDRDDR